MPTTEQKREYQRRYRSRHREKILAQNKIYRDARKEERKAYATKYKERAAELARRRYANDPDVRRRLYEANRRCLDKKLAERRAKKAVWILENQDLIRRTAERKAKAAAKRKFAYNKKYYYQANRKEWHRRYRNKKRVSIDVRILDSLRRRIRHAIRKGSKSARTVELLGCSVESFKIYLESRFEPGMTWENYGTVWEIDHTMPCAIFDLTKPEHQGRCFHFSNMKPLLVTINRRKHAKVVTDQYGLL